MSDSIEEKALRNDFREFLDTWTFGQIHIDAIMKACEHIVQPLEKDIDQLPEVKEGLSELKTAVKDFKLRFNEFDALKKEVKILSVAHIEKQGVDKAINWVLFIISVLGAFLGGLNFFK
jgi:hypothetical protein